MVLIVKNGFIEIVLISKEGMFQRFRSTLMFRDIQASRHENGYNEIPQMPDNCLVGEKGAQAESIGYRYENYARIILQSYFGNLNYPIFDIDFCNKNLYHVNVLVLWTNSNIYSLIVNSHIDIMSKDCPLRVVVLTMTAVFTESPTRRYSSQIEAFIRCCNVTTSGHLIHSV